MTESRDTGCSTGAHECIDLTLDTNYTIWMEVTDVLCRGSEGVLDEKKLIGK